MTATIRRAAIVGLGLTAALWTAPELNLRGDRFKPLTWEQLDPAQRAMAESVLSGERTSLNGPYNVFLRSPEMGDLAQKYGAQMRFHSSVPKKINELAILLVARFWTSQYEWYAHKRAALEAGLSPAIIDAIANNRRPGSLDPAETAAYNFCKELLDTRRVSDATFRAAVGQFQERGVVDLIGVMGYYHLVSMALNIDQYPLPEGAQPDLKPLN
jgi:4-carboxymuconolactone decarboxylase